MDQNKGQCQLCLAYIAEIRRMNEQIKALKEQIDNITLEEEEEEEEETEETIMTLNEMEMYVQKLERYADVFNYSGKVVEREKMAESL